MASLKSLMPALAADLGMSSIALYERQRLLVRQGLLLPEKGKGPGTGTRATGANVATLVLAVLASDSLTDAEQRIRDLAAIKPKSGECPLTGQSSLLSALQMLFARAELCSRVVEISVSRSYLRAFFLYKAKNVTRRSYFGAHEADFPIGLDRIIVLHGKRLADMSRPLVKRKLNLH